MTDASQPRRRRTKRTPLGMIIEYALSAPLAEVKTALDAAQTIVASRETSRATHRELSPPPAAPAKPASAPRKRAKTSAAAGTPRKRRSRKTAATEEAPAAPAASAGASSAPAAVAGPRRRRPPVVETAPAEPVLPPELPDQGSPEDDETPAWVEG